ncbi:hypothetical protein ACFC6L_20445 [Kitasatospora phosalacinea]
MSTQGPDRRPGGDEHRAAARLALAARVLLEPVADSLPHGPGAPGPARR